MKSIEQIAAELAHRSCTTYSHLAKEKYSFTDQHMIEFAVKVVEAWQAQQSPAGYVGKHIAHAIHGGAAGLTTITKHMAFDDDVAIYLAPPPAKVEQQSQEPVARQFQGRDGIWRDFIDQSHYIDTVAAGSWPIRELLLAPPPAIPGWISVEDRLPEDETPVLILLNGVPAVGERRWDHPSFEDIYESYWYWDNPTDDGQVWERYEISHWMPLPEPPAQGGKE